MQNGQPAFAVIPYQDCLKLSGKTDKVYFPHEVVQAHAIEEKNLVLAWRGYKGRYQEEMAVRMGISQPAYARVEKSASRLRLKTRMKIAAALGISPEQFILNGSFSHDLFNGILA